MKNQTSEHNPAKSTADRKVEPKRAEPADPPRDQEREHGEGNYKASKAFNDASKRFVESGRVEQAARDAEPKSEREAKELKEAEQAGKARAKEEDPEVTDPADRGQQKR